MNRKSYKKLCDRLDKIEKSQLNLEDSVDFLQHLDNESWHSLGRAIDDIREIKIFSNESFRQLEVENEFLKNRVDNLSKIIHSLENKVKDLESTSM